MHETELLKKVVLSFIDQVVVVTVAIKGLLSELTRDI